MRWNLKICALGLVAAFVAAEIQAMVPDTAHSQYEAIPERNVFGLRPPPAQAAPTNPPAQLPKIILTGITTILGNKRALMKVQPAAMKPNETSKELSLILTEGQREGEIEVLQIDENAGSVRVNNSGSMMTLTFEKDGAKLPATAPTAVPGVPSPLPASAGVSRNPYLLPANGEVRKLPTRNPRFPGTAPNAPNTAPVGGVPTPTGAAPFPALTGSTPVQDLTPEEQAIVLELQRQANGNIAGYPPLPPSPLTPTAAEPAETGVAAPGTIVPAPAKPRVLVPQ